MENVEKLNLRQAYNVFNLIRAIRNIPRCMTKEGRQANIDTALRLCDYLGLPETTLTDEEKSNNLKEGVLNL